MNQSEELPATEKGTETHEAVFFHCGVAQTLKAPWFRSPRDPSPQAQSHYESQKLPALCVWVRVST